MSHATRHTADVMEAAVEHVPQSTVRKSAGAKPRSTPNLFWYTTSGSAQDAFVSWVIAHADCEDKPALQLTARQLIAYFWSRARLDEPLLGSPEVEESDSDVPAAEEIELLTRPVLQYQGIDIMFVASVRGEPWVFLVSDQAETTEHPEPLADRLDAAMAYAEKQLGSRNVVPVYLKTGYVYGSDLAAEKVGYHVVDAEVLSELLDAHPRAREESDVFRDFSRQLHNGIAQQTLG